MSGLPEALARKVGPLPVGAWLGVAAGGIAAAVFMRGRTPSTVTEVEGADAGLDNTMEGAGNLAIGAADSNPTSTAPLAGGYPVPTTNEEWAQAVMRALIAKGYEPTSVDDALGLYLSGETLNITQRAVISLAIIAAGAPPQPVAPPVVGSPSLPRPSLPKPPTTARPVPWLMPAARGTGRTAPAITRTITTRGATGKTPTNVLVPDPVLPGRPKIVGGHVDPTP